MSWEEVKDNLFEQKVQNLISLTDYRNDELIELLKNKSEVHSEINALTTLTESEILPSDISELFKKDWSKLPNVHKIIKLKEFSEKISGNQHKKLDLENKLITILKDKSLKNSDVNYDSKNGYIKGINNMNKLV